MSEISSEIDSVIFYTTKVAPNRSFITKAFEFSLKYDPSSHSTAVEQVYRHIQKNIEDRNQDVEVLNTEIKELEELTQQVDERFDYYKKKYIEASLEDERKYTTPLTVTKFNVFQYSPVSSEQRFVDWEWKDMFSRIKAIRRKLQQPASTPAQLAEKEEARANLAKIIHTIRKPVKA